MTQYSGDNRRAVLYLRTTQAGFAQEADKEEGEAYIQQHGFIYKGTVIDLGSRPLFKRPGVKQIYTMMENKAFDVLVLPSSATMMGYKLSPEKIGAYIQFLRDAERYGIQVIYQSHYQTDEFDQLLADTAAGLLNGKYGDIDPTEWMNYVEAHINRG
jgi:hypothetical protein